LILAPQFPQEYVITLVFVVVVVVLWPGDLAGLKKLLCLVVVVVVVVCPGLPVVVVFAGVTLVVFVVVDVVVDLGES